jgi:phytanoyl-CoA dioxygenase PhyH
MTERRMVREKIRTLGRNAALVRTFVGGYQEFRRSGMTPLSAYSSLRELYWRSNGRFNDLIAFLIGLLNPPDSIADHTGVLGVPDELEIRKVVHDLRTRGYHVFDRRLPEELCKDLVTFAKTATARPLISFSDQSAASTSKWKWARPVVFTGANPGYVAYYFDSQKIMETQAAQKVVGDPWLLSVAQDYLRCRPVNTQVAMWWSTAACKRPSSEAAQLYHFDMDWIKFLKFFFYLTDVTPDTGPHCYVAGSHIRKPKALLRDGRFSDEEIERHYSPNDFIEILGSKGTIFVADTRGFHKGKPLLTGSRLLFQVEFAVNLFGQNYQAIELTDSFAAEFIKVVRQHPYTYTKFVQPRAKMPRQSVSVDEK